MHTNVHALLGSNKSYCDAINFKLTVYDKTTAEKIEKLIDTLANNGVTSIAAAGNDGLNENPHYPALYKNVFSVGSVDKYGNRSKYSTFPPIVDVLALGEKVFIPANCSTFTNDVALDSGTSFAAPAVAGLVALLLQCSRKYRTNGTAWKHITEMKVLKGLFEKCMVLTTEQGNLLQPEKVIRFFNDLYHNPSELDKIVEKFLESQASPMCID